MEGWRRLWVFVKWCVSIAAGIYSAGNLAAVAPPATNDSGFPVFMGAALAGLITFGFLSALEWVYRGFRPLVSPTAEPPATPAREARPTPHPHTEQKNVERL